LVSGVYLFALGDGGHYHATGLTAYSVHIGVFFEATEVATELLPLPVSHEVRESILA